MKSHTSAQGAGMTDHDRFPLLVDASVPTQGEAQFIDRYGTPSTGFAVVAPRASIYGIAMRGDHVLLTMPRWADQWELPGGGVDAGDDLWPTLLREVAEETGHTVVGTPVPLCRIETNYYADDLARAFHATMYFAAVRVSDVAVREPLVEETSRAGWMPLHPLPPQVHHLHRLVLAHHPG